MAGVRGEDLLAQPVFAGERFHQAAVRSRGQHHLAPRHAAAQRKIGDFGVHRQKIDPQGRDPRQVRLQPRGIAEIGQRRAQGRQRIGAKPGPERLEQHVGLEKRAIDVKDERFGLGHLAGLHPFTANTQPSDTSSGGVRQSPRATAQAASTFGT